MSESDDFLFEYRPGWPWRPMTWLFLVCGTMSAVACIGYLLAAGPTDVGFTVVFGIGAVVLGVVGVRGATIGIRITNDRVIARGFLRTLDVPRSDITDVRPSSWGQGYAVMSVRGRRLPFTVVFDVPAPIHGLKTFFQSDAERIAILRNLLELPELSR